MSSVIEQAAKRLEELRRAGAEIGEEAQEVPRDAAAAPTPTPEATVLALEARAHASMPASSSSRDERKEAAPRVARTRSAPRGDESTRHITLDFERLRARGFVTPDAGTTQIAEEFRVIKRPIIRNALEQARTRVRN